MISQVDRIWVNAVHEEVIYLHLLVISLVNLVDSVVGFFTTGWDNANKNQNY